MGRPKRFPRPRGGLPSRKTTFPVHHRPIEAKSQKATPETTSQKTSQEGNSEDTADGAPYRTKPSAGQSKSGIPTEVRTQEVPDAGAEGTTTPQRPDKAGRGQIAWALQGLSEPSNPRPDKMRSLPRQAQQEQVEPKRQEVRAGARTSVFTQTRRHCLKTGFLNSPSSCPPGKGNLLTHQAPSSQLTRNPAKQSPHDLSQAKSSADARVVPDQPYPDGSAAPLAQRRTTR